MENKINIMVFPCGTELGLEVYEALKYARTLNLIGANSVNDHGKFVYKNYVDGIPFVNKDNFISVLAKIVNKYKVDLLYPTNDAVLLKIAQNAHLLGCKVIGSPPETAEICCSKLKTYQFLMGKVRVPVVYSLEKIKRFPVFLKPEVGHSSKGTHLANSLRELKFYLKQDSSLLIMEYLPGDEYTVDCFTDRHGKLRFVGPRTRERIFGGIAVNTRPVKKIKEFTDIAKKLNKALVFRGGWFFQVKRDVKGRLCLMEAAPRFPGSTALFRALGVNLELLSVWDALDKDVTVFKNKFNVVMDRALDHKYKTNLKYDRVYVDLDDCLIINSQLNTTLVTFLYQCFGRGVKLYLISRHKDDVEETLKHYRLGGLFDKIIHIQETGKDQKTRTPKSKYISGNAIFIDDSFSERLDVMEKCKIPVFDPSAVDCLLE